LRLFAVFWWLLVIGSVGGLLFGALTVWESRAPHAEAWQQQVEVTAGAIKLASSVLPFLVMTIARRVATGRWRFGPRW
jgi:hypothetical protein